MPRRKTTVVESPAIPVRRVKSPAFLIGIFVLGLATTVGTVLLGRSDTGQIDVAAAVRESGNDHIDAEGNPMVISVPGEEFRNIPNGGLVAQDNQQTQPPAEETSAPQDGATTTDASGIETDSESASSTESSTVTGETSIETPEAQ